MFEIVHSKNDNVLISCMKMLILHQILLGQLSFHSMTQQFVGYQVILALLNILLIIFNIDIDTTSLWFVFPPDCEWQYTVYVTSHILCHFALRSYTFAHTGHNSSTTIICSLVVLGRNWFWTFKPATNKLPNRWSKDLCTNGAFEPY